MKKHMKSFRFDDTTEYALKALSKITGWTESETLRTIILYAYYNIVKKEDPQ